MSDKQEQPKAEQAQKKIAPKVTPVVTIEVTETTFNGKYEIVAIDKDGNEIPRSTFQIGVKGFEKNYKHLTEGTCTGVPKFRIKKNPH